MDLFELDKKLQSKLELCAQTALSFFVAKSNPDNPAKYQQVSNLYVEHNSDYVKIKSTDRPGFISLRSTCYLGMGSIPRASIDVCAVTSLFDDVFDFVLFFQELSAIMASVARTDFQKAAQGLASDNVVKVLNQVYFTKDVLSDLGYESGVESFARIDPISWGFGVGIDCVINEKRAMSISFFKAHIDDSKGHLGSIVNKTQANSNVLQVQGDLIADHENVIPHIFNLLQDAEHGNYR